jgi:hypothetical protein
MAAQTVVLSHELQRRIRECASHMEKDDTPSLKGLCFEEEGYPLGTYCVTEA